VGERIVFAIAAAVAIVSAIAVITLRNAFQATVALIGTLLSLAVIFLILSAPFVAAIQVIVYAGAIVVLFLFVIAYLGDRGVVGGPDRLLRYQVFGWIAAIGLVIEGVLVLFDTNLPGFRSDPQPIGDIGSPRAIGDAFLNHYLVPFEVTSLVLLVAAVGAVVLAKRAVQAAGGR
jgi:NADH-quinone oxidoreductase subunit J